MLARICIDSRPADPEWNGCDGGRGDSVAQVELVVALVPDVVGGLRGVVVRDGQRHHPRVVIADDRNGGRGVGTIPELGSAAEELGSC